MFKKLQEVNVAKATGHDNIPNKILKIAAPVISESLADLFNLSITTNTFPDHSWKVAKVFPLFKSGERNDPSNFRPISVLSTVGRLVYEQMYTYLTENNLIQPRQSGFRSLHSTVTALLDMGIEINGVLRLIEVWTVVLFSLILRRHLTLLTICYLAKKNCLTVGCRVKPLLGSCLT